MTSNGMSAPSSLQSALQMEANQQVLPAQQDQQLQSQQPPPTKRRRKNDANDEHTGPSEPRRLRRSHEACARCRGKKIKCDSKHPRCTACATAGVPCNQEDRHRQTLTPRGHTERIEYLLAQCDALLKRHIPGFDLENIDEILAREGIDTTSTAPPTTSAAFQFQRPSRPTVESPSPSKGYPPIYTAPHVLSGYPPPHPVFGPYSHQIGPVPGPYPNMHPAYQHPPYMAPHELSDPPFNRAMVPPEIPGQDPKANDMSNQQALAKSFGVAAAIVNDLKFVPASADKEDLAVGSSGLSSGRDRILESSTPRDTANWRTISFRRRDTNQPRAPYLALTSPVTDPSTAVDIWLPKDRNMVKHIVDVYFSRLNRHRPVFSYSEFEKGLDDLYAERMFNHDPGFICSVYLILALGTLSELNFCYVEADHDVDPKSISKKLLPAEWPAHDEFFERALLVKPDLLVTISSLQALILLHWYLYTERQGRTLWRLAGSLVRLAVELGLHHDPTTQLRPVNKPDDQPQPLFTEEECQLRIKLWGIVLVHDRGTSLLLGRPLAIAPSDANTPHPTRPKSSRNFEFSEHFELSHPIAEIQADIINSLYSPSRQSGDTIMRNATRIIKSMLEFRTALPERYQKYFGGTDDWTLEQKSKLVQDITEDEGLTLLKFGISRILLLRALFSLKDLGYAERRKALVDAIVTSHNIIIVHSVLIRFPDIAFFTSPIPLHIAAMVILYGHMSKCERLPLHTAIEDIWLALDMLPRFRWRWERKDANGSHPLIAKLAERVMEVNLHNVSPTQHRVLLTETSWEDDALTSPNPKSTQTTPTMTAAQYGPPNGSITYGRILNGVPSSINGHMNGHTADKNMVEVPATLFYPFYPEVAVAAPPGHPQAGTHNNNQDYNALLAAAAAQPSHETYMSEERNDSMMWSNVPQQRPQITASTYAIPP